MNTGTSLLVVSNYVVVACFQDLLVAARDEEWRRNFLGAALGGQQEQLSEVCRLLSPWWEGVG